MNGTSITHYYPKILMLKSPISQNCLALLKIYATNYGDCRCCFFEEKKRMIVFLSHDPSHYRLQSLNPPTYSRRSSIHGDLIPEFGHKTWGEWTLRFVVYPHQTRWMSEWFRTLSGARWRCFPFQHMRLSTDVESSVSCYITTCILKSIFQKYI